MKNRDVVADAKVLIAGAGLGGLSAAACLLKAGFDVEVFEQAPALGEVGAGIQLSANAMHVLNHLGLGEQIAAASVRPRSYVFRLHDTGEVVHSFPLADEHQASHGAPYNQIHRADLHDMLARAVSGLKPDAIRLNRTATGFAEDSEAVRLSFEDGSEARGDVLVGADGLKSTIRRQIAGETPAEFSGDAAWRITVPRERLPGGYMDEVMSVWMGPGVHCVCYYIRGGRLVNFVGLVETDDISSESWTERRDWKDLKADFAGWNETIQTLIDVADRDQCYRWSLYLRPPIPKWSTAHATLLGDAAHPTLPYLAQGAAMAIEDGAVLARALRQSADIADTLQLYERNRAGRTARIVEASAANRTLFHLPSAAAIRQAFAERDMGSDRNAWLYSYNPVTVELT